MSNFLPLEGSLGTTTGSSAESSASDDPCMRGISSATPSSSSSSSRKNNFSQKSKGHTTKHAGGKLNPGHQQDDAIGDAMARLLNDNTEFHFSKHPRGLIKSRKRGRTSSLPSVSSDEKDLESDLSTMNESFRPLFSAHNIHRLKVLMGCAWILLKMVRPMEDIPFVIRRVQSLFFADNRKQTIRIVAWFLAVAGSIMLLECIAISVGVAAISVSIWKFGRLLCFLGSSLLVDWKEIINACPPWMGVGLDKVWWLVTQVDRVILFGNRWRGREWNQTAFDFGGHYSRPLSSDRTQSLWKLPPPNALRRSSQMVPGKTRKSPTVNGPSTSFSSMPLSHSNKSEESVTSTIRKEEQEWSLQTTEHIQAIDYCYIMMREEFIQRQYTRLQRRFSSFSNDHAPTAENAVEDQTRLNGDILHRTAPISSIENFRQEFVLDPSTNNIDPNEVDEMTGMSVKLHEILEGDDSFDENGENQPATSAAVVENTGYLGLDFSKNDDNGSSNDDGGSASDDGTTTDMNWMDVGTEIGMKLLGSAAVQNALASHDTVEKITNLKEKVDSHFSNHKRETIRTLQTKRNTHNISITRSTHSSFNDLTTPPFSHEDPSNNSDNDDNSIISHEDQASVSGHYQLDPYAESLPVHPMWTSAAAAVSPTHSFATIENAGTHEDSTILSATPGRDGEQLISPPSNHCVDREDISSPFSPQEEIVSPNRRSTKKDFNLALPDMEEEPNKKKGSNASKLLSKFSPLVTKTLSKRKKNKEPHQDLKDEPDQRLDESRDNIFIEQLSPLASNPRRPLLLPGVKIAVPVLPLRPGGPKRQRPSRKQKKERFQMATVVSSKRICVYEKNQMPRSGHRGTNCLSITVNLDKCFLRNGQFATMTLRIMDDWGPKYMPKHSKLPMGSCVATSFGLGVLVGWRVEDDCHIVRSLWQRRGSGSACAYLRRDSIHSTMEAAVGFEVNTAVGQGMVVAYTHGGPDFRSGRYYVQILEEGHRHKQVLELNRTDVLSCQSAQFIPIIEHIRAAAQYQLQIDRYKELHNKEEDTEASSNKLWGEFSKHVNILWRSFLRAIEEDDNFDEGMNEFIQRCVHFLNQLDAPDGAAKDPNSDEYDEAHHKNMIILATDSSKSQFQRNSSSSPFGSDADKSDSGFWLMNNMFDIFQSSKKGDVDTTDTDTPWEGIEVQHTPRRQRRSEKNYARAFAVLRTLMRTVTISKAASADDPNFKIVLSICHEFLLFLRTVIKVQQKNMNHDSLEVWRSAWAEVVSVFGPVQKRLRRIGEGIAERMEKHGRRAKARLLRFVDIIVEDENLFSALEQGDWSQCAEQIERAMVLAKIVDEQSREHYHKTAQFLYNHFSTATSRSNGAAARNNAKLAQFLLAIQLFAAPRKATLQLFLQDWVLEMLERIFVRAFSKDEVASRMLSIHCSNFQNLRKFRMLKDFTIAGKLWIPLLDAADEEFSWAVSNLPPNAQEYLSPISSLFSLCVVQFHKKDEGDLTKDWLNFLMEDEAADIIHDLDMKLILALESFSRDIKETMVVLPYYPSIDVDILNLVDDINVDQFVKEASLALEDEDMLRDFIKEKATIAVERFLDYLPKMSIPVEKRDLGEGWTLTCRGAGGGDLTLTELVIKRENLTCQVMGGDSLLFPAASPLEELDKTPTGSNLPSSPLSYSLSSKTTRIEETSILTVIKEIILNAKRDGCWQPGRGGVLHPPSDKYAAAALDNLPVSSVLNTAIDLWRSLEIDDDELLEIAIRDVAYQIQLYDGSEEYTPSAFITAKETKEDYPPPAFDYSLSAATPSSSADNLSEPVRQRFNPRVDPTVLFLEIKKLTFNLENFLFRIEKHENRRTVFDPAFEGTGSILVRDVLIKLRVECAKGYIRKPVGRMDIPVPVLQLSELDVSLEEVKLEVHDTGADWLLNKIVEGFGNRFTDIISANLCDQVRKQMDTALDNLNGYFEENPEFLLGMLDISLDDLEEMAVFV